MKKALVILFFTLSIVIAIGTSYFIGIILGELHGSSKYGELSELSYQISCINQYEELEQDFNRTFILKKCKAEAIEFGQYIDYLQLDILEDDDIFLIDEGVYQIPVINSGDSI